MIALTFFLERLDQLRRLEVNEKVRTLSVMSLRLSNHQVLHNIRIFMKFFSISLGFSRLIPLLVLRTSKLLEFKVIPMKIMTIQIFFKLGTIEIHTRNI